MSVEDELVAFGAALDAALIANDAAAVARFFGDEWVTTGPDGSTTKEDLIGWIATGRLAHHSMATIGQPRILVYGEVAVITARRASTGSWDGVAYAAEEWMTEVYVRRAGRWVCVVTQKCPAAPAS